MHMLYRYVYYKWAIDCACTHTHTYSTVKVKVNFGLARTDLLEIYTRIVFSWAHRERERKIYIKLYTYNYCKVSI